MLHQVLSIPRIRLLSRYDKLDVGPYEHLSEHLTEHLPISKRFLCKESQG